MTEKKSFCGMLNEMIADEEKAGRDYENIKKVFGDEADEVFEADKDANPMVAFYVDTTLKEIADDEDHHQSRLVDMKELVCGKVKPGQILSTMQWELATTKAKKANV